MSKDLSDLFGNESPIPSEPQEERRETEDEQLQNNSEARVREEHSSLDELLDSDAVKSAGAGSASRSPSPEQEVNDAIDSSVQSPAPELNSSAPSPEPEVSPGPSPEPKDKGLDSTGPSPVRSPPATKPSSAAIEWRYDEVSDYSISSESSDVSSHASNSGVADTVRMLLDKEVTETVSRLKEGVEEAETEEPPQQSPEQSPPEHSSPSPKAKSPVSDASEDGVPKTFARFSAIDPETQQKRAGLGEDYKHNHIRLIIPNLDKGGRTFMDITIAIDPLVPVEEHTHCYILWPCHGQPPSAVFTGRWIWMSEFNEYAYECKFEHMRAQERETYESSFVPSSRLARILPTMPRPLKVKSRSKRVVPPQEGWDENTFKSPDHLPLDAVVPGRNPGEYFKVLNHTNEYKGVFMQQCDPTDFTLLGPSSNWQLWFNELDFPILTAPDIAILKRSLETDNRRNSATGLQLKTIKHVKSRVRTASEPPVTSKVLVDNLYDSAPLSSQALASQLVCSGQDSSTSDIDEQPTTRGRRTRKGTGNATKQVTVPGKKQVPPRVRKQRGVRSASVTKDDSGLPQPALEGDEELKVLMKSHVDETACLLKQIFSITQKSAKSGASSSTEADPETRKLLEQHSAKLEEMNSKITVLGADKDRNEEVRVLNQKLSEAREALVGANGRIREKEAIIAVEGKLLKEQAATVLVAKEKDIVRLNKQVLELTTETVELKKRPTTQEFEACQGKLESMEVAKLGLETENNNWQKKHEQLQKEVAHLHKQLIKKEASIADLSRSAQTSEEPPLGGSVLTTGTSLLATSIHSPTLSSNSGFSDQPKAPTSPSVHLTITSSVPTVESTKTKSATKNNAASRAIQEGRAIGPFFKGCDNYYYNRRKDERYPRSVMCFDGSKRQTGAVLMPHMNKGFKLINARWVSMSSPRYQQLYSAASVDPNSPTNRHSPNSQTSRDSSNATAPTGRKSPVLEVHDSDNLAPKCDSKPGQKRRAQQALFKEVDDSKRQRIDIAACDLPLNVLLERLPSNTVNMMKQLLGTASGTSGSPVALGSPQSMVPSSPSTVAQSPGSGVRSPSPIALVRGSSSVQRLAKRRSVDKKLRESKEYHREQNSHMRVKEKIAQLRRRIATGGSPSKLPKYKETLEKLERKQLKYQSEIEPTIATSEAAALTDKQAKEALEKKRAELTDQLKSPSILSTAALVRNLTSGVVSASKSQKRNTMPSGFPKDSPGTGGGSRKRKKPKADGTASSCSSGTTPKSPSPLAHSPPPSIPRPRKTPGGTGKVKTPSVAKVMQAAAASPDSPGPGSIPVAEGDAHVAEVAQYIHARESNAIQDDLDEFIKPNDEAWRYSLSQVNQMPPAPADVSMAKYGVRNFRAMQNCTRMMAHTMGYMNRQRFQGPAGMELVSRGMRRLKSLGAGGFRAVREALWEVDTMLADMCVMSAIFWQVTDDNHYSEVATNQLWLTRQRMSCAFHRAQKKAGKVAAVAP